MKSMYSRPSTSHRRQPSPQCELAILVQYGQLDAAHGPAGPLGHDRGLVGGPVVHDDHQVDPGQLAGRGDGRGNAVGLVLRRDNHGDITGQRHRKGS